jgi:hypothetical protein
LGSGAFLSSGGFVGISTLNLSLCEKVNICPPPLVKKKSCYAHLVEGQRRGEEKRRRRGEKERRERRRDVG